MYIRDVCACIAGHHMLTQLRASRSTIPSIAGCSASSADLLIIDDLGLRALPHDEPIDTDTFIERNRAALCDAEATAMRYGRRHVLLQGAAV